ncbi:MAG: hypothetical protein MUF05_05435 [Candidatus Omnitrophica bacterium]|jgi:tetratricopeptide (TPR) repeat protein|nr:hypothetical protein [Candidatus Omnitrophota bacterium]
MLRSKVLFFIIVVFFIHPVFAANWKTLHDKASGINLNSVSADALSKSVSQDDLYVLGLVYLSARQEDKAKEVFIKVRKIAPSFFPAQWGVAEILRRKHDLEESKLILDEIIADHPEFIPARLSRVYIYYLEGEFHKAMDLTQEIVDLGSEQMDKENYLRAILMLTANKGMVAHYGGIIVKLSHGRKILPLLRKAQSLAPYDAQVYFGLGSYYLLSPTLVGGNKKLALEYLEKAKDKDPRFADIYVRLAQACRMNKDEEGFKKYLDWAFMLDPGNELANDFKSGKCRFICPVGY